MCDNPGSRQYIIQVVNNLKSDGTFDQLRRECLTDVDTKPSYRNLLQRVEGYVSKFLSRQSWSSSLNKNQLRNRLRIEIDKSEMLKNGIDHLVDQIVNEKIKNQFRDKIEIVLKEYLGIKDEEPKIDNDKLPSDVHLNEEIGNDNDKIEKEIMNDVVENVIMNEEEMQLTTENSNDIKIEENLNDEYDKISNENYWPTPPKPEMCTPEHDSDSPLPADDINMTDNTDSKSPELLQIELIDDNQLDETEPEKPAGDAVCEPPNVTTDLPEDKEIAANEDLTLKDEPNEEQLNELVIEPIEQTTQLVEPLQSSQIKEEQDESDISEISSVHTSDLSSFDDEISFDDTDEETNVTKKKVSLKVAKKLAASISEVKVKEDIPKIEQIIKEEEEEQEEEEIEKPKDEKKIAKRKRKLNPKFTSTEFSYNLKSKKPKIQKEEDDTNEPEKPESTQVLKRKKIVESSDKVTKLIKQSAKSNEIPTKKSQQTAVATGKSKKTTRRNDQSNKRYDSSDLYKPRHSLSSRRTRSGIDPLTPDSNSNSTIEDIDK